MNHDPDEVEWPQEAGDRRSLPTETAAPAALEDRVVETLLSRGLIHADKCRRTRVGVAIMRTALATAAALALIVLGMGFERHFSTRMPVSPPQLTGAETDLYALLLYETDGYVEPTGAGALAMYREYSHWVADARRRGQFVTGEDLAVDRGWRLIPTESGSIVEPAASLPAAAPLSGLFFIRAGDSDQAIELARRLPHIRYGGQVLVQKTMPTDSPPEN